MTPRALAPTTDPVLTPERYARKERSVRHLYAPILDLFRAAFSAQSRIPETGALALAATIAVLAAPTTCQGQATTNLVAGANDAFGLRVGLESIGLYSESQVRGFNLATAGNYRIDGAYYVPTIPLQDPIVSGVVDKVGWNALSEDFPAPSGVVEYQLRSPKRSSAAVEGGLLEYGSPYLDATFELAPERQPFGFSGGAQLRPNGHWSDGSPAQYYQAGVLGQWRINDSSAATLFASGDYESYPGLYGFSVTSNALPSAALAGRSRYQASWSRWSIESLNGGAIVRKAFGAANLQGSLVYSAFEAPNSDFTILSVDQAGSGNATGVHMSKADFEALSAEIKATYTFRSQRLVVMARLRNAWQNTPAAEVVAAGPFHLGAPLQNSILPAQIDPARTRDNTIQKTLGIAYEVQPRKDFSLQAGLQKTQYAKTDAISGSSPVNVSASPILYNASLAWRSSAAVTLFGSITRGLEESGRAPYNASNRSSVIQDVIAQQYEMGAKLNIAPYITLVGSIFRESKPYAGFDSAGVYGIIGVERHDGVEVSISGKLTKTLDVVAGAVALKARVVLENDPRKVISVPPLGVSPVLSMISLDYRVPHHEAFSIDISGIYLGRQVVRYPNRLDVPGYATIGVGGRYKFDVRGSETVMRLYLSNILDNRAWVGSRSGLITPNDGRAVRFVVGTTFK